MIALHDSGRGGKLGWAEEAVASCGVTRVVLSPFETPPAPAPRRRAADDCIETLQNAGAEVLLDPATHILSTHSNRLEYYNQWSLWSKRNLNSRSELLEHVKRCLAAQQKLGLRGYAPTLRLTHASGAPAANALAMVEAALTADPKAMVTIAGGATFWSVPQELDIFIGELAQLKPSEVSLTVVHDAATYPPPLSGTVIANLCRTTHALSLRSKVFAAQLDLAALPLVAAGASMVGTGWDLGQRVLSLQASIKAEGQRRNPERVTHRLLLAVLKRAEALRLFGANASLSKLLVPGSLPADMVESWKDHLKSLAKAASHIAGQPTLKARVDALRLLYSDAAKHFSAVGKHAGPLDSDEKAWISPLMAGLNVYAAEEGC